MERVQGAGNAEQSLQTGDNTALMAAVVVAIARAREDPLAVIARFQRRLTLYNGVSYADPNKPPGRRTVTKEGAAAVEDAIRYLSRMKGGGNFSSKNIEGLALAAEDHADDIGRNGCVSHTGSDGSTVADRQMRYGRWAGYAGECLWYGCAEYAVSGESIVDDLIVDDGVPSRGHRLCIFEQRAGVAGAAIAAHQVFGSVVCIEFAGTFAPAPRDVLARRQHAGAPVIAVAETAEGARRKTTQWKLGPCSGCGGQIHGGSVVELGKVKFHRRCYTCRACSLSLTGNPSMIHNDAAFCKACWVENFAPVCGSCQKQIDGSTGTVKSKGGKVYHKACWESSKLKTADHPGRRSMRARGIVSSTTATVQTRRRENPRRSEQHKRTGLLDPSIAGISYGDIASWE